MQKNQIQLFSEGFNYRSWSATKVTLCLSHTLATLTATPLRIISSAFSVRSPKNRKALRILYEWKLHGDSTETALRLQWDCIANWLAVKLPKCDSGSTLSRLVKKPVADFCCINIFPISLKELPRFFVWYCKIAVWSNLIELDFWNRKMLLQIWRFCAALGVVEWGALSLLKSCCRIEIKTTLPVITDLRNWSSRRVEKLRLRLFCLEIKLYGISWHYDFYDITLSK